MSSSKRKSSAKDDLSDSSLSDLEDVPTQKKVAKNSKSGTTRVTSGSGDQLIDLTGRKYVCVRNFKGRVFVDIREYYEDSSSGELKPGKKGVSLNVEQWEYLKSSMDEIDEEVAKIRR